MMCFCHQHIVKALRRIRTLAFPEDVQLVKPFQVELDGTILGVDLEGIEVFAPLRKARRFHRPQGAVFEVEQRHESVIHI